MSFGYFYEIKDRARDHLVGCTTKSEWYNALGGLNIEDCPSCKGEQSFPGWELALGGLSGPLARMFEGDLRAQRNEFDDPDLEEGMQNLDIKAAESAAVPGYRTRKQLTSLYRQFAQGSRREKTGAGAIALIASDCLVNTLKQLLRQRGVKTH